MATLPESILAELFNLRYQPTDIAIDYLADSLRHYNLTVMTVEQRSSTITLRCASPDRRLLGNVRIQRLDGNFTIEATLDGDRYLSASGDWTEISKYCDRLRSAYLGDSDGAR